MNYVSTRDSKVKISSAQAIVRGLSADGGLFMPESIPVLNASELEALTGYWITEKEQSLFFPNFLQTIPMRSLTAVSAARILRRNSAATHLLP